MFSGTYFMHIREMVESVFTIYKHNPEMMVEWEGNNRETTFDWNIRILGTRDDINWYIVVTTMNFLFFFLETI